jgi:hypothetical protein
MQGETQELWQELCKQASTEQDPAKLTELIKEINRLLEEKHSRLNKDQTNQATVHRTYRGTR